MALFTRSSLFSAFYPSSSSPFAISIRGHETSEGKGGGGKQRDFTTCFVKFVKLLRRVVVSLFHVSAIRDGIFSRSSRRHGDRPLECQFLSS